MGDSSTSTWDLFLCSCIPIGKEHPCVMLQDKLLIGPLGPFLLGSCRHPSLRTSLKGFPSLAQANNFCFSSRMFIKDKGLIPALILLPCRFPQVPLHQPRHLSFFPPSVGSVRPSMGSSPSLCHLSQRPSQQALHPST